jgi:hypothetical protein
MVVGIEESNPGRTCLEEAGGAGGLNALIVGKPDELNAGIAAGQLLQQRGSGIRGVVIDNKDLDVCECLRLEAGQR